MKNNHPQKKAEEVGEKIGKALGTLVIAILIGALHGAVVIDIVKMISDSLWFAEVAGCTSAVLFYIFLNKIKSK